MTRERSDKKEWVDINKLLANATREVIKNIVQDEEVFYAKYSFRMALLQSGQGFDVFKQVSHRSRENQIVGGLSGLSGQRDHLDQRSHQAVQTSAVATEGRRG